MRSQGTSLRTYLLTRLALAIPTVLILLTMVFLLMRVAPGNPIQAALGGHVSQEEIAEAAAPRPAMTGRSSPSTSSTSATRSPSTSARRSPTTAPSPRSSSTTGSATLELTFCGLRDRGRRRGRASGWLAGRYRDTWIDTGGRLFGIFVYAAPVFFTGFLLQLLFGSTLGWLTDLGRASARSPSSSSTRPPTSTSSTRSSPATGTRSATCSST